MVLSQMNSIFDKYGGFATISKIVRDFYKEIGNSAALKPYFEGANLERLIDHQTKFMSQVLGGPAQYDGRELAAAHARLKISEAAFAEVASILQEVLEDHNMEDDDVAKVMAIVGSVKDQIVTAP